MPILGDEINWDEVDGWLETIETECSDRLNTWESNFIADMRLRASNRLYLTRNQRGKLKEIYEEKTR